MRRQVRLLIVGALLPVIACKRDRAASDEHTEGAAARGGERSREPLLAGAVRVNGKNFHVDVAPASGCATDGACSVLADLTALAGFKVNREYPFRFVPDAASQSLVDGEAAFAVTGSQTGRLMVPVRRDAPAASRLAGTFKLSVCNADLCQIENAELSVAIP